MYEVTRVHMYTSTRRLLLVLRIARTVAVCYVCVHVYMYEYMYYYTVIYI